MRRALLLLSALLVAGPALPGQAAPPPKPQVTDPAGDAVGTPGMDVVKAVYATTGTGVGKKYVPKKFIVTLTTAAPVETLPGVDFTLSAQTTTCGTVNFIYQPGTPYETVTNLNGWAQWGDCASKSDPSSNIELLTAKVSGNNIVWSFSLKGTPLKVGTVFSDFHVWVDPCDPIVCLPLETHAGLVDTATGTGTWKLG